MLQSLLQPKRKYRENTKIKISTPKNTNHSIRMPPFQTHLIYPQTPAVECLTDCLEDGDIAKVRIERGSNDYYFPYVKDDVYVDLRRLDMWVNQDEVGKSVAFSILPWIGEGVAFPTNWEILD